MKLSYEDKKEIVRLFKVQISTIQNIINRFEKQGLDSLMHPPRRKEYSAEFKSKIIKLVYEGYTKSSLAAEYNLPGPGTIVAWMKKYDEFGYNGLVTKKRGRPKMNLERK